MRKLILLVSISALMSSCLKNDVLKDEYTQDVNFKESSFYTSGQFDSEFDISVDELIVEKVVRQSGDTACRATVTFHIADDYLEKIASIWDGPVKVIANENPDFPGDKKETPQSNNLNVQLTYIPKPVICDTYVSFLVRLELIDPHTTRVSAHTQRFFTIDI